MFSSESGGSKKTLLVLNGKKLSCLGGILLLREREPCIAAMIIFHINQKWKFHTN